MKNLSGGADSRPAVTIHIDGKLYPGILVQLSEARAIVGLLRQPKVQPTGLVSLSIAGLPTFPGDIVDVDGAMMTVEFRSALHPSVVQFIEEEAPEAGQEACVSRPHIQPKRATARPPFPFGR